MTMEICIKCEVLEGTNACTCCTGVKWCFTCWWDHIDGDPEVNQHV